MKTYTVDLFMSNNITFTVNAKVNKEANEDAILAEAYKVLKEEIGIVNIEHDEYEIK